MTRRMYRYDVPVDGQAHTFYLTSGPVHVETTVTGMEFWAEHEAGKPPHPRAFRVFGTGDDLPDEAAWVGTGGRTQGGYVGHLYEVAP
jgi:hypothetical protein